MLALAPVVIGLVVVLFAGCATGPRRTGAYAPDWESPDLVMAPAVPAPALPRAPAQTNDVPRTNQTTQSWVALADWCKANHLGAVSRLGAAPVPTYELSTPRADLVLRAGSRLANLDGTQLWLGYAPQVIGGQPFVHALDLKKTLEPLLADTSASLCTGQRTVVIDPGHGGEDAGTRSIHGDFCEKDATLDWARRLEPLLAARGWRVVLTRRRDMNLSLSNRLALAEAHKADLFLSLHFNSSAPDREQGGIETYCLTPAGQPSSVTRGFSDDLAQAFPNNAFDTLNLQVAFHVQHALLQINGCQDRGVRRARYLGVLRGQHRAAILIEGGYLSNPREARLIAGWAHRQKLAEALAKGLGEWAEVQSAKAGARGQEPGARSQESAVGGQEARGFSQTNSLP